MKLALSRKNLWDKLPKALKGTIGRALSIVPLERVLGRQFRRTLAFATEAQWWNADTVRTYQLEQLRRIATLAYERTPFYRKLFDAHGFDPNGLKSLDDFAELPTIDKSTVLSNLNEMCAVPPQSAGVDFVSTGGTSGIPLNFYIGADRSAVEYAYLVASWQRAGFRLGMPVAIFRGLMVPEDADGLRHKYDPLLRQHAYSNFHMTDENMQRYLAHLATIGPCFLHVYPSSIAALTRFIQRRHVPVPTNVRGIIAESEMVYPDQREAAEKTFGVRFFSCYGHTEKLVLGAECEHSTDYHVWPTYGYFELIDEHGRTITTPGRHGEIAGTGFINKVMPFIRYRTGDYATYVADRCEACGRQHVLIRDVQGHRTQEMLIASDGAEISWTAMNMHDDTFLNVRQFQFYQTVPGQAVLRLVPDKGYGDNDRDRILRNLGRKFDHRLDFTIDRVDAIALSPRGKAIYIDQRITTNQMS